MHSSWTSQRFCCLVKGLVFLLGGLDLQTTISEFSEFADDNFEIDENGRQLFKMGRKHCGKGEIARYEQFLLFP